MYNLVKKTENKKTGKCAVLYTSRETCPPTCPLRGNGCYAETGRMNLAWNHAVNSIDSVLEGIQELPRGGRLRLFPAGDLPGAGMELDVEAISRILLACVERGLEVWGYTHKDHHIEFLLWANSLPGVTLSVSCSTLEECNIFRELGLPTTLPVANVRACKELGKDFIPCNHAVTGRGCSKCNLCMGGSGNKTVCFPVHGSAAKKAKRAIS